jgi:hypothetical protein
MYIWCADVMFVNLAVPSHRNECIRERDECMCIYRKAKKEGGETSLRLYSQ